jgi:hypothetical protein
VNDYDYTKGTMRIAFRHDVGLDLRYLIARVTGAPVHVVTIYDDTVVDATFNGVLLRTVDARFASGRWEVYTVDASYFNVQAAKRLALSRVGVRYDWWGVLVAWWIGRRGGEGARTKLFCSEQCAGELLAAGVPLRYQRAARYTPRLLRDELRSRLGWTPTWIDR